MEISPILLFWLFIYSVCFGGLVGVLNDLHRFSRVILGVRYTGKNMESLYKKKIPIVKRTLKPLRQEKGKSIALSVVIGIQDILLFSFAGVGTVLLNYYYNDGQIRYYTIPAVFLGFLLYYFSIGKLTILIFESLWFVLRAFFAITLYLISRPVLLFVGFFWKKSKKIYANVKKTIAKKQKIVYNIDKYKMVIKEAENGFLEHLKF